MNSTVVYNCFSEIKHSQLSKSQIKSCPTSRFQVSISTPSKDNEYLTHQSDICLILSIQLPWLTDIYILKVLQKIVKYT